MVESCVEAHRGRAEAKDLTLSFDPGALDDETLVLADEEAIRQIFDNLIDNAIKYTPEGGSVRVAAARRRLGRASRSPTPASASPATTCRGSSSGSTASTRPGAASWAGPGWASRSSSTWSSRSAARSTSTSRVGLGLAVHGQDPALPGPGASEPHRKR